MKPLEIKGARTRLGYTQQYMADQLETSVHSYQKKESGKIKFTEAEKFKVGKILGLNLKQLNDYLFDGQLDSFLFAQNLPIGNKNQYFGNSRVLSTE